MTTSTVRLWGRDIGAVSWDEGRAIGNFEYEPAFRTSGIEIAPLTMPLSDRIYSFPALPRETYHGLPGLLADSLPDKFGNALIDVWLARQGRTPESFNPVERLCYTGVRGMGALEYSPARGPFQNQSANVDLAALVELASDILTKRGEMEGSFLPNDREATLLDILRVGTSAGGARAKAIIAWNEETNEVRSGQVEADEGFTYWLLKFDGVSGNKDKGMDDPAGYGLIEYGYYLMARAAYITMNECRLLKENGRSHFMTKRFDRTEKGGKLHMQSLCAMQHYDYNQPGAYSYEQALQTIRKLGLPMEAIEEQFRRMAFNVIARNQDDHVKNIAFLMDRSGKWSLSPAYDLTYAFDPQNMWMHSHQMSLNGKRDNFTLDDFKACADLASMKRGRAEDILREVHQAVLRWHEFAEEAGIPESTANAIKSAQRLDI